MTSVSAGHTDPTSRERAVTANIWVGAQNLKKACRLKTPEANFAKKPATYCDNVMM